MLRKYNIKRKRGKKLFEKKGQLKIQEMAFILLAVIFLFALVLLMFTALQTRNVEKLVIQTREARAITMTEMIASMPELRCSSSFSSTSEAVCVDRDKLEVFSNSFSMRNKYRILWDNALVSKVEIQEVFPPKNPLDSYLIYSTNPGEVSTRTYSTYTSICYEEARNMKCTIGKIKLTMIMVYVK